MNEIAAAHRAIDAVWRIESARLIAALARMVRDVGLAEDLAHDALLVALERWPTDGVPPNPGGWLMATAKRRAIDQFRHASLQNRKADQVAFEIEAFRDDTTDQLDRALDDHVGDDLLGLIFAACHPVLSMENRVALTLRLLGGLTTDEIARAFVLPESTIAQRIVRAKRTLREAHVPIEVPRGADLIARIQSVLEVIYLIYNEGYSATAGDDWMRPELCDDALRLGRTLASLTPEIAEVHGLVALMEIQSSRTGARVDHAGRPVLLFDQDRTRWNHVLIQRGLNALARAESLGGPFGTYALQAAIAACHATAKESSATDWTRIVALYDALLEVAPSPVVELNRAVALSMMYGPAAGLEAIALLTSGPIACYSVLHAVRGDFLFKLGRYAEARESFEKSASLTRNEQERFMMVGRAEACNGN